MLKTILFIIELVLFIYLSMALLYITTFGIAALFARKKQAVPPSLFRKIAVLIPGYKEDHIIVEVAKDALEQEYPKDKYEVIVIADSFMPETITALNEIPVRVVEVVFEISKKSKALNKCMAIIGDEYDIAVVLDADNIMAHDVLHKINLAFDKGFVAVQGHRMAKNTNTPYALLDAISEEINNTIFRKGHRVVGLSSALIGSGMGIDYALFKKTMATVDSVGEDKELELKLLKQGHTIEYVNDACIYDEKTSKSEVFVNQRRRWVAAQLDYFRRYFFDGFYQLISKGNIDYFDKVMQMIQPPRIILTGLLFIFSISSLLTHTLKLASVQVLFILDYRYWLPMFLLTSFILLISVPKQFYNKHSLRALLYLPHGFILMTTSIMRIKGARKRFIHTTHHHTETFDKSKMN